MRKFYYLFLTMLLGMVGMTANAEDITVTVNVDNGEAVTLTVDYSTKTVNTGDNQFTLQGQAGYGGTVNYNSITVNAKTGFYITKIEKEGSDNLIFSGVSNYAPIYPSSSDNGAKYKVTTASKASLATGVLNLTVDDPSKVTVSLTGQLTERLELTQGSQTINFIPEFQANLQIESTSGAPLYKVIAGTEEVQPSGTSYYIPLDALNTNVNIQANFPAGTKNTVTISYVNSDKANGFITGVTVDGNTIENYLGANGFEVDGGKQVAISFNSNDYMIESFKINGTELESWNRYSPYSFYPTSATTITIDAHQYGTINANVTLTDPNHVTIYNSSYDEESKIITVTEGKIQIDEKNKSLYIKPNSGCYITSVTVDGVTQNADYKGCYTINSYSDGSNIVIESGMINRDKTLIVYVDDKSQAQWNFALSRADRSSIDIENGYNEIAFYDGDLPITFAESGAPGVFVYLDDKLVDPFYTGGTSFEFADIKDGNVLKIFVASETDPTANDVSFTLSGDEFTASDVTVTYDRVKTLSDLTAGLSAFAGTEVSIAANNNKVIEVKVNGVAVNADTEGVFTFTVSAATTVEIKDVTPTGINSINAENADNAIYSLQGVKVNGKAKGLYIKNGKKVVVK